MLGFHRKKTEAEMAKRKGWLRRVVGDIVCRLRQHDLMMMAAAIAFYWLLGIIPLLLLGSSAGRATLAQTHLRLYAPADYARRWNEYFQWIVIPALQEVRTDPQLAFVAEMTRKGITKAANITPE